MEERTAKAAYHTRFDSLMENLKMLTKSDSNMPQEDNILEFVLKKVVNDVSNYTHIQRLLLPEELDHTIVAMCLRILRSDEVFGGDSDGVSSLNEGDTSIHFKSAAQVYAEIQAISPITDDYVGQLNQFRKVKW